MEVPEEVGIDFHVSEELGYKVTSKGNPVIGAGRCEVRQVIVCLDDFMMCNAVTLNKETGKFQEKDEEQCGHILFFCPELIRANRKAANNGHDAAHQDKEAEEFEEEIEKRTDCTGLKDMGERKEGYAIAQFHEIPCGKPLDHIDHKGGDKSKHQQRMSEPAIERLAEKFSMEDDLCDKDFHVPSWPHPEFLPASPDINLEFLPLGGLLCPFEASFQPDADVETHAPDEENHRWEEHDVENKVFVHDFKKGSRGLGFEGSSIILEFLLDPLAT